MVTVPNLEITGLSASPTARGGSVQKVRINFKNNESSAARYATHIKVDGTVYRGIDISKDYGIIAGGELSRIDCGEFIMPDHDVTGYVMLKGRFEKSGEVFECDREAFSITLGACVKGTYTDVEICPDGITIAHKVCRDNRWVPTGKECPAKVCTEGAKRSPETCWNGTTIHKEVCRMNKWVPSGEVCPTAPKAECTEGDKKPGHVCVDGKWKEIEEVPDPCAGVVCNPECVGVDRYAMVCKDGVCVRGALMEANRVECGYVKPECAEGDKKAGHVCSGGKWISTMPGHVHGEPSTIEAPEIIPGIKPPRIPLLTPELANIPLLPGWVIRDADGRIVAGRAPDTIEFQEIIPGIKPPRVPQLIPSLENLPLLPGWTIRNREGTVVAHGAPLPTIGTGEP
jgi:hypothetical protein